MLSKFIKTSIGVSAAGVLAIATVAKCTAEVLYNNRNDIADKAVNILSEAKDNAEFAMTSISNSSRKD